MAAMGPSSAAAAAALTGGAAAAVASVDMPSQLPSPACTSPDTSPSSSRSATPPLPGTTPAAASQLPPQQPAAQSAAAQGGGSLATTGSAAPAPDRRPSWCNCLLGAQAAEPPAAAQAALAPPAAALASSASASATAPAPAVTATVGWVAAPTGEPRASQPAASSGGDANVAAPQRRMPTLIEAAALRKSGLNLLEQSRAPPLLPPPSDTPLEDDTQGAAPEA